MTIGQIADMLMKLYDEAIKLERLEADHMTLEEREDPCAFFMKAAIEEQKRLISILRNEEVK